jgi:ferritin
MHSELLNGLNEHLTLEFRASHEYLAMFVWLAEHDLPGFATWMRKQSGDELLHAQKVIDHLVERDQKVKLPAIPEPPSDWASAQALVEHVHRNEQAVTASINNLYAIAEKAKDRPATILLQWFVNEQVEEESMARAVLGRLKLAGATGIGLLMIDQELAAGKVPGMMTMMVPTSGSAAGA